MENELKIVEEENKTLSKLGYSNQIVVKEGVGVTCIGTMALIGYFEKEDVVMLSLLMNFGGLKDLNFNESINKISEHATFEESNAYYSANRLTNLGVIGLTDDKPVVITNRINKIAFDFLNFRKDTETDKFLADENLVEVYDALKVSVKEDLLVGVFAGSAMNLGGEIPNKFKDVVKYEHHGQVVSVITSDLGRHRDRCLCWQGCKFFKPEDREENCPHATNLFNTLVDEENPILVAPVAECSKFERDL